MLFGEIAEKLGYVSQKKIQEALLHQKKYLSSKKIGEILIFMGCLTEEKVEIILQNYKKKSTQKYREIDRYNIEEKIGSGGFGVVYQAYDTKLNRIVALKMTKKSIQTPLDELKKEARNLATFNHRNIVQVHDFGTTKNGQTYIVMEYIRGENLLQNISRYRGQKKYLSHALHLCLQIIEALVYLEKKGICHQDIKPQNIIVDSENNIKIVDFGLASSTQEISNNKGYTPKYTAPERTNLTIKPSIVGDIYSFGGILLDVISQQQEHSAVNMSKSLAELFPPNSQEKQRRLLNICQKCLQKDFNKRYQSAISLYSDLLDFNSLLLEDNKEFPYLYLLNAEVLFYLKKPRNYIGRSFANDFILHNDKVSRVQLSINVENYIVNVENLSENGKVMVCQTPQNFPQNFPKNKIPTTKKLLKQNQFITLEIGQSARLSNKSLIKIENYIFCFIEEISFMRNRFCKTTSAVESYK
ncbi:FHA domain-containing serine/threonine-protein kinase [Candidatus Uabimicrobium sp. HlEnr_7]|uniref:serine/threonine-protein kinase n=1 Tax=Candidatus Uabimicrobium helgolandensis TaxID=3095367 RepID=UPI003557A41F